MGIIVTNGPSTNTNDVFIEGKESQSVYMRGVKVWEKISESPLMGTFTITPTTSDVSHSINMTTVDASDYEVQCLDANDAVLSTTTCTSGTDVALTIKANTVKINIIGDFSSMIYGSINDGVTITEVDIPKMPSLTRMYGSTLNDTNIQAQSIKKFSLGENNISDMSFFLAMNENLTTIEKLYTSNTTIMNGTFGYCTALTALPEMDTSKVTSMSTTFFTCTALASIPPLNTSNVTIMDMMFAGCPITTIPLLDTSKVTSMIQMFNGCSALTSIPALDLSSSESTFAMFSECSSLTTVPQLNIANVTDASNMFYNCSSLTIVDLLNSSKVTNMNTMFYNCTSLTSVLNLDTSSASSMSSMFYKCTSLTTIPKLDISNVTIMNGAFNMCTKLSGEITIRSTTISSYANIFTECSTDANANFVVNYIDDTTKAIAEGMVTTKSANSKILLGTLVS